MKAGVGIAWALLAFGAFRLGAAERPNILFIVSEDNGPELGCYGQPYVQTPVLDALASEGIRFDRAYVPQAGCSQSRAAFMTGLYPHQNGQIGLATWKFALYDAATPNLVRSLKQSGYRTGLIGKLHIHPKEAFPFDFEAISSSNFSRKNPNQYATEAGRFMAESEQPFFLSVNYPDAHRPFLPQVKGRPELPLTAEDVTPLDYFGLDSPELRRQTADYLNCMTRLDSYIGDLLSELEASGKRDNTLIVYLGDHGADLLRGKRTSYEGGLRVPLILSWPGQIESGQVRPELVSTLDLLPTLLEVAGASPVQAAAGRSLKPMFRVGEVNWRRYLFTEYHTHSAHNYFPQRTVRDERFKLIVNLMPDQVNPGYDFTQRKFLEELPDLVAAAPEPVRSAYERMERPPRYELYDLQEDPHEFRNLAQETSQQKVLSRLISRLERWQEETDDPMRFPRNVQRLKAEIDACLEGEEASKDRLHLHYADYFFTSAPRPAAGKNVLFIAIDDLRPALACYGDPVAITPHLDRLAARGTRFLSAYCQEAVCAPSRLSLLSGRRPDTIEVWDLKTHFREALPDLVTLPQHFKQAGYTTRSIGKIYHGSGPASQDPPSWSEAPLLDTNRDPELRYATAENLAGEGLKRDAAEAAAVPDDRYIDGVIADRAVEALQQAEQAEAPFFLAVGFKKPHLPFCAPQCYWDLYERDAIPSSFGQEPPEGAPELAWRSWGELEGYRDIPEDGTLSEAKLKELRHGYYACVSYIDAQVGRLLDQLDASGLAEDTVICLWGDHGFHLGEQGLWTKANNYELSTRVPLIVVDPDKGKPGQSSDALVELIDLYPTLVELCELEMPEGLEGLSLVPLLENPDRAWKSAAFSQYPRDRRTNRHTGRGDVMGYTVRTRDHRYVEWQDSGTGEVIERELYDLREDPQEGRNLATDTASSAVLDRHAEVLRGGWKAALPKRPNVLFLAVDDMKDWVNCLGGYEGTVHTPHLDRLAARGTLFANAHCPSPKCAPSRAAILTGLMPSTTGLYDNSQWWYATHPEAITLPLYFRHHGYRVAGAGKVFHHTAGNHPPNQWDAFRPLRFRDDPWFRGVKENYPWSAHEPYPDGFPFSGVTGLGHENDWGVLELDPADYDDARTADYAIQFLQEPPSEPFFLACGLFRPHLPWYVPQDSFDLYPLDEVVLPEVLAEDLADVPEAGRAFARDREKDLRMILKAGKHREAVQAYLASISYADAQLGRVLDALDASGRADDTVIVLWSDHGWHLGEKGHWHKSTLWEEATRVPFIVVAPGFEPGICRRAVSLVDLFPTLNALCGLPALPGLDGDSLIPQLRDPQASRERPALIQYRSGNVAVRDDRFRYIRYADGSEELYDLKEDPQEWHNRVGEAALQETRNRLQQWATTDWAEPALTKRAFDFDPDRFSWREKATGRVIDGTRTAKEAR